MTPFVRACVVRLTIGLSGCASSPLIADGPGLNVPQISRLDIAPTRVTAGCPGTLRFHADTVDVSSARAIIVWDLDRYRVLGSASEVKRLSSERKPPSRCQATLRSS